MWRLLGVFIPQPWDHDLSQNRVSHSTDWATQHPSISSLRIFQMPLAVTQGHFFRGWDIQFLVKIQNLSEFMFSMEVLNDISILEENHWEKLSVFMNYFLPSLPIVLCPPLPALPHSLFTLLFFLFVYFSLFYFIFIYFSLISLHLFLSVMAVL